MTTRSKYSSVESAHCLKVQNVVTAIKKSVSEKNPETPADKIQAIVADQISRFEINKQSFVFSSSVNHLGGSRWYIHCPKCSKKCLKLYKPDEGATKELGYQCQGCHGLKSPSSLHGPTKMYKDVIRPLRRMKKLREMLDRPISSAKAAKLVEEHDMIEKKLRESDQYKVYKFKLRNSNLNLPH